MRSHNADAVPISRVPTTLRERWLASGDARRVSASGSENQVQLLESILKGFPPGDIVAATLGMPPAGFQENPEINQVGSTWLNITVDAQDRDFGQAYANWEAQLLAGAFREASHTMGLPDVLGTTITLRFPDGSTAPPWSAAISQAFGKRGSDQATARARIDARLHADPRFLGASVSFIHALQGAPVVTVRVAKADDFPAGRSVALALLDNLDLYEGSFVRVLDSSGKVLRVAGYATLIGIGSGASGGADQSDGVPLGPVGTP